jgi:hypothetical protein
MSSVPALATEPVFWEADDAELFEEPAKLWSPHVLLGGRRRSSEDALPSQAHAWQGDELHAQFEVLADELASVASGVSSTRKLVRHPAYLGILELGEDAIPLLLGRLTKPGGRPIWLKLLSSLTPFQPGAGRETIEEAASDWVSWGKRSGQGV